MAKCGRLQGVETNVNLMVQLGKTGIPKEEVDWCRNLYLCNEIILKLGILILHPNIYVMKQCHGYFGIWIEIT